MQRAERSNMARQIASTKASSSAVSQICSSRSPLAQASMTAESIQPMARTRSEACGDKSPSSAAARSIVWHSSPRYTPAVSFSKCFWPGLWLFSSSMRSKSPPRMPSYIPDSRFTIMLRSESSPSLPMRLAGREQQVFVPVPLTWPMKPL